MKTKIENLIKSYEAEIKRLKSKQVKLSYNDPDAEINSEKIYTLKGVIYDLKQLIESEG